MTDIVRLPQFPFPVTASSHPDVWHRDGPAGAVIAHAPGHTDFYVNPGGADSADAETMLNAVTLLGLPPVGDFQFSARVSVDFRSQYDAGVLLLWADETHWGKFCFEFSPASSPMVVYAAPGRPARRLLSAAEAAACRPATHCRTRATVHTRRRRPRRSSTRAMSACDFGGWTLSRSVRATPTTGSPVDDVRPAAIMGAVPTVAGSWRQRNIRAAMSPLVTLFHGPIPWAPVRTLAVPGQA